MAVKVAELYETLELDTRKFKKDILGAKKDTGKFSKMLGGIGTAAAAGAAAAGAALAGAAAKGVKEFANFDKQMNEVFTLMPKASKEAQKKMSSDLRDFSNEMGVATDEAAPALYQAISAGVPKDNVFNFMEEAQKAAAAGVTDLTTSVDVLSSVVNTYGKENISAAEASDLMFTAVKQGKTTFEELSTNMSDVAPIASSMGVEFSNVTAALSTMTSQGTPTAKATTQLKQAMSELSKEGSKAGTAFQDVAGTDFQTFISEGGNLQEAMALMEDAAKENGTTVSNMFGSIEAGQAALALTGEGAKKFKGDLEEMNNASGATDKAYKKMEESLTRNFERIQVGMNEVWLTVGEQLMPIMKDLTDWVIANMPKIQATAETVFSAVSDAIYWGIDAYKQIKSFVEDFVGSNSNNLDSVMNKYSDIFGSVREIIEIFVDWATKFWDDYGKSITETAKTSLNLLQDVFETKLDFIGGILESVVKLMKGDFEGFGEGIADTATEAFENVRDIISGAWQNLLKPVVSDLAAKIVEGFNELPSKMREAGGEIVKGLTGGLTDKISSVGDATKNLAEETKSKFTNWLGIESPSKVFMGYGRNIVEGLGKGIEDNSEKAVSGLQKLWNDMQKAKVFEEKWEDKLFGKTATTEEKLMKQKEQALRYAREIGADTNAVRKYFELELEKYRMEQRAREKEAEQSKWDAMNQMAWDAQAKEKERNAERLEMYNQRFGFLKSGMQDAFTSILQGTSSVTEAFGNLWQSVLDKVMAKLAEMAASKVFNFLISGGGGGGLLGGIGDFFGGIFHNGGTVPGPIGQERMILTKAGETVSPIGSSRGSGGGGYSTANIMVNLDGRTIAQAVKQPLVDSIRIKGGAKY